MDFNHSILKLPDVGTPLAGLISRFVRQSREPLSRFGQGTTDLQIGVVDAHALAAADPKATLKLWDGVNHLLKTATADRAANMATYADPTLPLAPGVAEDVGAFIRAN